MLNLYWYIHYQNSLAVRVYLKVLVTVVRIQPLLLTINLGQRVLMLADVMFALSLRSVYLSDLLLNLESLP